MNALWAPVLAGALGCYLVKLAGLSVPPRLLHNPQLSAVAALLPVALLAALVAIQAVTTGHAVVADARMVGLAAGASALLFRAPFMVVVGLAAVSTALLRLALH